MDGFKNNCNKCENLPRHGSFKKFQSGYQSRETALVKSDDAFMASDPGFQVILFMLYMLPISNAIRRYVSIHV